MARKHVEKEPIVPKRKKISRAKAHQKRLKARRAKSPLFRGDSHAR